MIYLIGASGHAKVVLEILEVGAHEIGSLCDANPSIISLLDYKVVSKLPEDFNTDNDSLIISIGNNSIRKRIANEHSNNYTVAIHPRANISKRAVISEGTVVMSGVCVNSETRIGMHCIINTNSSIDHDCSLENFVHVSPNAVLAGNVFVGEGTHIGIGASIIQGIKIGKWATIGAGAVIVKDVPDYAVVVGNPGRIIKYNGQDAE
jgi:sugar O-acyltransferase (sialic acid O-acetyltransferase NeuD family)